MPSLGLKLLCRQAACGFKLLMTLPHVVNASASASASKKSSHGQQEKCRVIRSCGKLQQLTIMPHVVNASAAASASKQCRAAIASRVGRKDCRQVSLWLQALDDLVARIERLSISICN
jgi:hypothetical protein